MFNVDKNKIAIAMVKKGLNIPQLSKACSLADQTIYRMMRNGRASVMTIHKVAIILEVPVEEIMLKEVDNNMTVRELVSKYTKCEWNIDRFHYKSTIHIPEYVMLKVVDCYKECSNIILVKTK